MQQLFFHSWVLDNGLKTTRLQSYTLSVQQTSSVASQQFYKLSRNFDSIDKQENTKPRKHSKFYVNVATSLKLKIFSYF